MIGRSIMAEMHAKIGEMGTAMANAPLHPIEPPVKAAEPAKGGKSPLPTPTFTLVANPKAYEDRNDKAKTNTRIAHVLLRQGAFMAEASIYLETKIEQTASGRNETKTVRFSLPKGVKLADDVDSRHADTWKDQIIDAFIDWQKASGGNIAARRQAAGSRTLPDTPAAAA